ncbi:MAG TPA: class II aldolase/adducin family protein [Candidatus Nanoarchaeia archaeon]|nr:class II aldolase/adducin family protein [Candidatus Nanoarchaeia archaeon]
MDEGVIKFTPEHRSHKLHYSKEIEQQLAELNSWRRQLFESEVIGCDLSRYGACYGNVSMRYCLPGSIEFSPEKIPGHRAFLITGTQTGKLENLASHHFARVYRYDPSKNKVWSEGPSEPSSESMTHGAVYDLHPDIKYVFHVHSPSLWKAAASFEIPVSSAQVAYGTPEMAAEVKRLFRHSDLPEKKIFSMGGHEDGLIAFGSTAAEVGSLLVDYLQKALAGLR